MTNRYPIIYIRGYAMTAGERNETAADPFCGFNLGSTLYRALDSKDKAPEKMVFESPVVRLMSDFQYRHVYQNGFDILHNDWEPGRDQNGQPLTGIPAASIVILRYYDDSSDFFGNGSARHVTEYARLLNDLILKVRARFYENNENIAANLEFKCYLVAHSMGGLVARAFLQGNEDYQEARQSVDKLFTFATPHNGIDMLDRNVPSWLTKEQANTFNRTEMAEYLNLQNIAPDFGNRVDLIPESALHPDRIFCMIGTNRGDYEVLQGAVRAFVGHGSDGLVKIDNASLWGFRNGPNGAPVTTQVATAYAFRSHSGYHGIVNSEEAYQNLVRFLFGDVRIDIFLDIESVSLPVEVQQKVNANADNLEAGYQFEFRAAPKGKRWYLTRRQSVEDSPACRTHDELTNQQERKSIYLSSVFLSKWAKVDNEPYLSYAMSIAAKVPDYIIDRRFWRDGHFEGADLFRGTAVAQLTPPAKGSATQDWEVRLFWTNPAGKNASVTQTLVFNAPGDVHEIRLPFENPLKPGIKGVLRLKVRPWK